MQTPLAEQAPLKTELEAALAGRRDFVLKSATNGGSTTPPTTATTTKRTAPDNSASFNSKEDRNRASRGAESEPLADLASFRFADALPVMGACGKCFCYLISLRAAKLLRR